MIDNLSKKVKHLRDILRSYGSLAVALSGGVDSAFLITIAKEVLDDKVLAITAKSIIHLDHDLEDAKHLTEKLKIKHLFFNSKEMILDDFILNRKDRCFFCKKNMFEFLRCISLKNGFYNIAHGVNVDDIKDYRPGLKVTNEMGVLAPLMEANFSKKDVRCMALFYGLEVWNKPSESCLATRFPYGMKIDITDLNRIKKAERILFDEGFKSCRVRHYGDMARIEIDLSQIGVFTISHLREKIVRKFKNIGYTYISLDLEGYRQGSMNYFN